MTDWDRCIHCEATGCLDDTVTHGPECPFTTDLWPVTEKDDDVCCACDEPFKVGDVYTHVKDEDHWMMSNLPPGISVVGFSLCLPCAALDRKPT